MTIWNNHRSLLITIALLSCIELSAASRRYVYVNEAAASQTLIVCSSREVHDELGLTDEQLRMMNSLGQYPMEKDAIELVRTFEHATSRLPVSSRIRAKQDLFSILDAIDEERTQTRLREALSIAQYERLQQIMLQVYGPRKLLDIPRFSQTIGISIEQEIEMKRVINLCYNEAEPIRKALGRYAISGEFDTAIDNADKDRSLISHFEILKLIEERMDHSLIEILDDKQKLLLDVIKGKPFNIEWSKESAFAY